MTSFGPFWFVFNFNFKCFSKYWGIWVGLIIKIGELSVRIIQSFHGNSIKCSLSFKVAHIDHPYHICTFYSVIRIIQWCTFWNLTEMLGIRSIPCWWVRSCENTISIPNNFSSPFKPKEFLSSWSWAIYLYIFK